MAGDVATAGSAGTDVTRGLPTADDGMTSGASLPERPDAAAEEQNRPGDAPVTTKVADATVCIKGDRCAGNS